ncbi:MAG TPA: nitrogenase component 1 [Chloroflexia bacterium]|nr:nitrogenase component 1 [Chloroflexia bacterium]
MPDKSKDPFAADFDPMADDDFGPPRAKIIKTPRLIASEMLGEEENIGVGGDDFGSARPKAARKLFDPIAEEDLEDDLKVAPKSRIETARNKDPLLETGSTAQIGFTASKTGVGDFWASARSNNKPGAEKRKAESASNQEETSGPTKNAFVRRKDSVKLPGEASERERIRRIAEATFGEDGKDAPNIPLDTPVSNGYWGAMWAFTSMKDVEVVVDAPVGCYSLPATATVNYTDALPELENLASSNITEIEVTLDGTTRKVLDAVRRVKEREQEKGLKKHLIVISSQESELIGADHVMSLSRKHPDAIYFTSHAFEEDEWRSRDSSLLWLYEERKRRGEAGTPDPQTGVRVNIIGPTYGCFNSYADLHEIKRLIKGAGGEIHYVYPMEANYADMDKLEESAVNVVMYREFGGQLAEKLEKPYLYGPVGMQETTEFIRELGRLLGTSEQAEAFIRQEKRDTLLPIWDIWLGAPQDFYNTTRVAIIANESYALGLKRFLGEELGMPVCLVVNRQQSNDANQWLLRNKLAKERPTIVLGSMNERIYIAEAGVPSRFLAASLPMPLIMRSVGTPYMGYRGCVYLMQVLTNMIFEVLFEILPKERRTPGAPGQAAQNQFGANSKPGQQVAPGQPNEKFSAKLDELSGGITWTPDAKAIFDQLLEKVPWVARISASDKLRQVAIAETRAADQPVVTPEFVMKALPKVMM